jgi:hypothetical protein
MRFKTPKVDTEKHNKDSTSNLSTALVIPDSLLAKEATDIMHEHSTDLPFNHSIRVYLFAAEQDRQQKLCFDPELLLFGNRGAQFFWTVNCAYEKHTYLGEQMA